ncbi:MAG: DUF3616 domain-containing protein [Desulfobacterales bacterium]|nr:DUF3616 domain-containing protein [Desulfobacterales bacterium]
MKKLFLYITLSIFIFSNSYGIESINSFIKIDGNIISAEDVSGITKFGKFIIIGSDEAVGSKNYIQLLKRKFDRYIVYKDILLLNGKELDIEGIAEDGEYIYIIGSHSSKRKKVKKSKRYEKNRSNFFAKKVEEEIGRDWFYRIKIDPDGKSLSKDRISSTYSEK